MDLTYCRSDERLGIERRVNVGDVPAKLAPNYCLDFSIRKRSDLVEEAEEFVAVTRRKEVES